MSGPARGQPSSSYAGRAGGNDVAELLSVLARQLEEESGLADVLTGVVGAAVQTVPGAKHAGITVVEGRSLRTCAATDEVVRVIDRIQYETGQGPCVDAARQHETLRLSDMAADDRWPEFRRRADGLGVRSMLSFQLYVIGDDLGALNLYSDAVDAFTDESEYVGLMFAAHAAVAMVGARRQFEMNRAIAARDVIGQAKGILMERHRLTADRAFDLLIRASQQTNTKLTEIARALTETGRLPAR